MRLYAEGGKGEANRGGRDARGVTGSNAETLIVISRKG